MVFNLSILVFLYLVCLIIISISLAVTFMAINNPKTFFLKYIDGKIHENAREENVQQDL